MTIACAKAGGINLAQGVCDTPVPEPVRRAAQAAIEEGWNTYTRSDGLPELRRALAAKMRRDGGLDYDPEGEIVVTSGATGAFYVAVQALLEPGDEVVLFEPYYGYHRNTLESLGMRPAYVSLEAPGFAFEPAALEAALGPRTRALVINTPGNPSGKVWTRAELEAVGRIAQERELFIFTDEVYEHFVFDGRKHVSPAALPGLRERTVTMNALSKTFAITGWRIGWLAAPARWRGVRAPTRPRVRARRRRRSSPARAGSSGSTPSTTRRSASSTSASATSSARRSPTRGSRRRCRRAPTSRWPTSRACPARPATTARWRCSSARASRACPAPPSGATARRTGSRASASARPTPIWPTCRRLRNMQG
jgi:aspartate/methionine/tyrosine aminotransferase